MPQVPTHGVPPSGLGTAIPEPAFADVGMEYAGKVPYKWAGANPNGWDCSGMWNWILANRFHMVLPGGVKGFTGSWHGPVVAQYAAWSQSVRVPFPERGDLCLWVGIGPSGHMGVCTMGGPSWRSSGHMVSALNPTEGTAETPIEGTGPAGAPLVFRRITGGGKTTGAGLSSSAKGCLSQLAGAGVTTGGLAAWMLLRKHG